MLPYEDTIFQCPITCLYTKYNKKFMLFKPNKKNVLKLYYALHYNNKKKIVIKIMLIINFVYIFKSLIKLTFLL